MDIVVTGGTGELGRSVVARLRERGHTVRVLSREPGQGRVVADLRTGAGLGGALDGVGTVVHCATHPLHDTVMTERLVDEAERAGVEHIVHISIVGVDRVPYFYYNRKLAGEQALISSSLPITILRATQFHSLLAALFRAQRHLPLLIVPDIPVQPIAAEEVAARLSELAEHPPAGRVEDIGGPQLLTATEAARAWQRAHGSQTRMLPVAVPGRTGAGFRAGHHTTGLPGYGRRTFSEFAAERAAAGR
jgi:uncharacterized protein YbjT (DUF2867 family)